MIFHEYTLASEVQSSMCTRIYTCRCNEECSSYGELIKILRFEMHSSSIGNDRERKILPNSMPRATIRETRKTAWFEALACMNLFFFFCDLACMNLQSYCNIKEALFIYLKVMSGIHDDQLLRKAWHDLIILPMTLPFLMLCLMSVAWAYHHK
jgi:hypothetical protein